ncbi:MAG: nucleotidyl transferase AbiEii/AbiGii toxin family protein [Candidatus Eremiobacteraeota bacterium]|nr:nucleotidyl transferase AbiEii/AbiGii toxin family protein [Candidatus Eremiobacteraeota bacterium]
MSASPTTPKSLDLLAVEVLNRLKGHPAVAALILGGGIALKHYLDFRPTHDIDAWWVESVNDDAVHLIDKIMKDVAEAHGFRYAIRTWGDTASYEIRDGSKKVFSFQVSVRDVQLEPAGPSTWAPLKLESLADNVGSKMNAVVRRGAPRDFVDIYELVTRELVTADECWRLWQRKNPGVDVQQAKESVARNMSELELRTPLGRLPKDQRERAENRRTFFKTEFIGRPDRRSSS